MNNLKTREEFLNEGYYEWLNKPSSGKHTAFTFIGGLIFIFFAFANNMNLILIEIMSGFLFLPFTILAWKKFTKNLYDKLRSKTMLNKADKKCRETSRIIEKYPDIEEKMGDIKINILEAIKNKNNKIVSKNIHEIYNISKELKKREGNFLYKDDKDEGEILFALSDKEKRKYEEKRRNMKKVDPYGEEDWSG